MRALWQIALRSWFWLILFAVCLSVALFHLLNPAPAFSLGISLLIALGAATLATAVAMLLNFIILAPIMLNRLRRTPGVLGEHLFEVSDEGLREVTGIREVRVAPGNARRLIRTRNIIIAVISARAAFLLPRRDFADAAAYDDFWKALQPLARAKKN